MFLTGYVNYARERPSNELHGLGAPRRQAVARTILDCAGAAAMFPQQRNDPTMHPSERFPAAKPRRTARYFLRRALLKTESETEGMLRQFQPTHVDTRGLSCQCVFYYFNHNFPNAF